jgi:S1-C subfamily serine protease
MKKNVSILLLLVVHCSRAAESPKPDLGKLSERFTNSLVLVEYELQFDDADAPMGGLGAERCSGCGQFHGSNLRKYLEEERPVEAAGYLVGPDRVVTKDPQLHPRFIKSIAVRLRDHKVAARVSAHARTERGIVLALGEPLPGGTPLAFATAKSTPVASADLTWQLGRWCAAAMPFTESLITPPGEPAWHYTRNTGIAIGADGSALGVVLDGWLAADDTWQGSPLVWAQESSAALTKQLDGLRAQTHAGVLRVHLTFRSPKTQSEEAMYRSRYSRSGEAELDADATEADVPAVLMADGRLLVFANLDAKVTARLERIDVYHGNETPVAAKFTATLKDVGLFVATLAKPLSGGLKPTSRELAGFRDSLLLRADVELHGESRNDHFQTARFSSYQFGPKRWLLPQLDGDSPDHAFIFTADGELVAFSAERRSQNSGDHGRYRSEESDLVPAAEVFKLVAALPGSADASNVPVSEAEENKLAWLGAELQPLNQELARANNVSTQTRDGETGALVTFVHPDSPAARSGLVVGSVLLRLKVPGRPLPVEVRLQDDSYRAQAFPWDRLDEVPAQYFDRIPSPWSPVENNFIRALTDLGFGTKYTLEFFTDGKAQSKELAVEMGPTHFDSAARYKSEPLGITVRDLTYEVRRYLQRKTDEPGVVVSKVEPGGRAGVAGVRPYELITHVNDQPVNNVKEFETLTAATGELKLSMKRMAKGRIVTVKPAN